MTWHPIRLREPWDIQPDPAGRGWVFRRHFQRPTGLAPGQRVDLVIESVGAIEQLTINQGSPEPSHGPNETRFRIDGLLQVRNRIEFLLITSRSGLCGQDPGGTPPVLDALPFVRIEIQEP